MKRLFLVFLYLCSSSVFATELRFDGLDCTKPGNPPLQSKIIVTNFTGTNSYFSVTIIGGNPPLSYFFNTCIDKTFGDENIAKNTQSVEGLALYAEPYLYVFVPGKEYTYIPGTSDQIDRTYAGTRMFKFSVDKTNFTLISEEMLGNFQGDHISYTSSHSKQPMPKITYQLIDE